MKYSKRRRYYAANAQPAATGCIQRGISKGIGDRPSALPYALIPSQPHQARSGIFPRNFYLFKKRGSMKSQAFDLITVGGGLGASALAIAMAREGARVLVLEKEEKFPGSGSWGVPGCVGRCRESDAGARSSFRRSGVALR